MNEEEEEVVIVSPEQQAINEISDIAKSGLENVKQLKEINQQLSDINYHISSLDDYIVEDLRDPNIEIKKNEQETKETNTEEETKAEDTKNTEEVTISTLSSQIEETNTHLENIETYSQIGIFSIGALLGVILFTLFWNRVFK